MSFEFLWYIPNQVTPGHHGEPASAGHNSLDTLTAQARAVEEHGWKGALIGAGWGRPDTFTVATALTARTATFEPLIAVRPGYWHPANVAKAAATLDHLVGGRVRLNIVSGTDNLGAYGDAPGEQADRYARTKEFMRNHPLRALRHASTCARSSARGTSCCLSCADEDNIRAHDRVSLVPAGGRKYPDNGPAPVQPWSAMAVCHEKADTSARYPLGAGSG